MLNRVQLCAAPWTVVHQTPLSMEFFKEEYWSGLALPTQGDLPHPGIDLHWQEDSLPLHHLEGPFPIIPSLY